MTRFRKVLFSLLSFLIVFTSLVALAQTSVVRAADPPGPWYNQSFNEWYDKVYDNNNPQEIFGERYTNAQVQWIFYSIFSLMIPDVVNECNIVGSGDITGVKDCFDIIQGLLTSGGTTQLNTSPLLFLANMSDFTLRTKPASGITYTANVLKNANIIPEAYAQTGFGFEQFEPTLALWRATRNIAFTLMVIVFIAMAFMIMFRVKISPQAVITVQSAIPKMVTALILITFSYAIAGFMFDLTNLAFGVIAMFAKSTGISDATIPQIVNVFFDNTATGMITLYVILFLVVTLIFGAGTVILTGGTLGAGLIVGAIPTIIFGLITIMLFIILVRIAWMLLRTYVLVVFQVILAPLQILVGTFTQNGGFVPWLRGLASNLAVFPTVGIMFFISHVFFWGSLDLFPGTSNWTGLNPFQIKDASVTGSIDFPFFGDEGFDLLPSFRIITFFASFVILFLIPHAANIIRAAVQGQQFNYGTAIGQAFGPVQQIWGASRPYRNYETGRQIYEGTGLVGGTVGRLIKDVPTRQSIAQSVFGYRK